MGDHDLHMETGRTRRSITGFSVWAIFVVVAATLAGCTTTAASVPHSTVVSVATGVTVTVPPNTPKITAAQQPSTVTAPLLAAIQLDNGTSLPSALAVLSPAEKLTVAGSLPAGGVELTFHVAPAQVAAGSTPFLASLDPATGKWTPAASTYDAHAGTVSAHVTHFSIWTVLTWVGSRIAATLEGALSNILASDSASPTAPSCSGGAVIVSDSRSDHGLATCGQAVDSGHALVKVVNARTYPVDLLYPVGATVSAPDTDIFAQLGADLNNLSSNWHNRVLLPGGDEADITLAMRTGQTGTLVTEMDAESYLTSILGTAVDELAAMAGKLEADSVAATADAMLTGLDRGTCLKEVVNTAQTISSLSVDSAKSLGAAAFDCVSAWIELGSVQGLLDLAKIVSSLATELVAGISGAVDSMLGNGTHTLTISRPQPILGQPWAPNQEGYGVAEPGTVFNGGDPTGLVSDVRWQSWGGPTATGQGTSDDDNNSPTVAAGIQAPATIVAFDLGTCQGKLMYQAIEWYFPQDSETFDPHNYINICTGQYVGGG